jgi:ribosomal protein L21E
VRGCSLVPFKDRVSSLRLFGPAGRREPPFIPGWYTVSKRGLYHSDIAYGLFFNEDSGELQVVVAAQQLKLSSHRPEDDIGQDVNACRLFSPDQFKGQQQAPYRGWSYYLHKRKTFVSGLLLLTLKLNQVAPLPTPSPHQISFHVALMVDLPFMAATYQSYNQRFWKSDDLVIVSNSLYQEKRGVLLEIELENRSATVRLLEGEKYISPLSNLRCSYSIGDVVRVIENPFSNMQNVHHQFIGQSGMVSYVDFATEEITVTKSDSSEVRPLAFNLFYSYCRTSFESRPSYWNPTYWNSLSGHRLASSHPL